MILALVPLKLYPIMSALHESIHNCHKLLLNHFTYYSHYMVSVIQMSLFFGRQALCASLVLGNADQYLKKLHSYEKNIHITKFDTQFVITFPIKYKIEVYRHKFWETMLIWGMSEYFIG